MQGVGSITWYFEGINLGLAPYTCARNARKLRHSSLPRKRVDYAALAADLV